MEKLVPSQMKDKTAYSLCAYAVGALAASVPANWKKKCWPQHDTEVPFTRTITDLTGMSSQLRNGDTSVGYLRQVALRRVQCDMITEEDSQCLLTAG
jgi:hypothetical protein